MTHIAPQKPQPVVTGAVAKTPKKLKPRIRSPAKM